MCPGRRCHRGIGVRAPALLVALLAGSAAGAGEPTAGAAAALCDFQERFSSDALNEQVWRITRQNDFQESTIDIVGAATGNGRLRMRAATLGTDDSTVKFHGVRTLKPVVDFSRLTDVSVEIDWNNQRNGCYLKAGLYLCPQATDSNPRAERDWLKVEYIGVPPGRNGRCLVASKVRGGLRHLFTEGWPKEQRTGRRIDVQHVRVRIGPRSLKLFENGTLLFELPQHKLEFTKAYVYLQMSSHNNYPAREVFFDNVEVKHTPQPIAQ